MVESLPQPDTIFQLRDAVYPSFAMLAGMELDLFTPLAGGPLSVEQIAGEIGVQPIKLRPLLYALVVAGLLKVEDDLFSNTVETGRYLVRGQPAYLGGMHGLLSRNWRNLIKTADAVSDRLSGSYDVVVARALAQVLSAGDSRSLLNNLAAVLNPGGVLHLIGSMLDNSRLSPQRMVSFNLVLLNSYDDGQAYTEQEYRDWLAEAGLVDFERVVLANEVSIVTARKPD